MSSLGRWCAAGALLVFFAFFTVTLAFGQDESAPDPFPVPEAIQANVEFWIRVFGVWSTGQVVIHDARHPELVYEVLALPGRIGERYTDEQKEFVEAYRSAWRERLLRLEALALSGQPLDNWQKEWAVRIATVAGSAHLQGAHDRLRSQRGLRERFKAGLERSQRYDLRMREIFRSFGLPEDLAYLPHVESSFQSHARSSASAVGLWQFTRPAAKRCMTLDASIDERLDPIAATRGAARYLQDALSRLEAWPLALTSYNHGVEGMLRAKSVYGTDFDRIYREYQGPYFGFASRNFYAEFLAARTLARDPAPFFPEGLQPEPPLDCDDVVLTRRTTPAQIAKTYGISHKRLASLNPAWTSRALRGAVALPAGTQVWLPPGTLAGAPQPSDSHIARASAAGVHVVRAGETLSGIAQKHGVSLSSLRRLNTLSDRSNVIHVGQRLRLGSTAAAKDSQRLHIVRRGETLMRIASSYRVRLIDLLAANGLTVRSIIHPGQGLRIPGLN